MDALNLEQYLVKVRPEPFEYLDPAQNWGSFTILSQRKGEKARSISRPLCDLEKTIDECIDSDLNYWISQASFNRFNRQKVNLQYMGVSFVDLDFYTIPKLAFISSEKVLLEHVFPLLRTNGIPYPSLVIDSGRGLQIKWYTDRIPARALPRWDRLQTELCDILKSLGADNKAKDVCRILRLENTYNQKNGKIAKVIWSDIDENFLPEKIEFNKLCNLVLPYTQEKMAEIRTKQKSTGTKFKVKKSSQADVIKILSNPNARTIETLNWNRLHDLKKIIDIRGGIADGSRELMAFYLCNFYALRYAQSGQQDLTVWHEFYQLCRLSAPAWTHSHAVSKVNNVFALMKKQTAGEVKQWRGEDVPMLYVPRNDTMINLFEITDTEQEQLVTIISSKEKQRRNTESHKTRRRNDGYRPRFEFISNAQSRTEKVLELSYKGFKQKEISELMNITINAVKSIKKRAKTKS